MSFQTQNNGIGGFGGGYAPNALGLTGTIAGTELATPWASTQSPFGGFASGDGYSPSLYGLGATQTAQQANAGAYLGLNGTTGANANATQNPLGQLVSLFANMLQALMGALGGSANGGGAIGSSPSPTAGPTAGPQITTPQTYVQNATVSSTGDPHLSASGTAANGTAIATKYDSMTGHRDLVDSDSFAGGYRVSTQTTAPDANGITYNRSATVRTGDASVTVDNAGNVTVKTASPYAGRYASPDGPTSQSTTLASGQSMTLDSGATVTKNADGSVTMSDTNASGGSITTTFTQNGKGVDVVTSASNADLGGDVMGQATGQPAQRASQWREPLAGELDPNAPAYLA
jgi:hypothetical protein